MNTTTRLAAVALVAVLAIGGVYLAATRLGGPAAQPTPSLTPGPTPIDTSAWTPFVSAKFGLSFKVPVGWTAVPAHQSGPDPIGSDSALAPAAPAQFIAVSRPVAPGTTNATWLASDIQAMAGPPPGCPMNDPSAYVATTVDGHDGYLFEAYATCGYGRAIVVTGGRAYELTAIPLTSEVGHQSIIDHPMFEAWLSTVRLDPTAAKDPASPVPS